MISNVFVPHKKPLVGTILVNGSQVAQFSCGAQTTALGEIRFALPPAGAGEELSVLISIENPLSPLEARTLRRYPKTRASRVVDPFGNAGIVIPVGLRSRLSALAINGTLER